MNWQETVLSVKRLEEICESNRMRNWPSIVAQEQAEASFKAGQQEGRREVVEYIEEHFMVKDSPNPDFLRNGLVIASPEQWQQAKLKEWGIQEGQ